MLRKTLTILSLIGLLLSLGLWGVSCGNCGYRSGTKIWILSYGVLIHSVTSQAEPPHWFWVGILGPGPSHPIWLPQVRPNTFGPQLRFSLPLWIPTLVFGISLCHCRALHGRRRRRRKKLGLCLICGYDLRGSKRRCPECGTEFTR